MLRIINVMIHRRPYAWNPDKCRYMKTSVVPGLSLPVLWQEDLIGDVVDIDKQKKLCSIAFTGELYYKVRYRIEHNLDITEETTITGELEQLLRERYDK